MDEESEEPGLILFPQDPARRLNLGWRDPERKRGLRQIFIAVEPLPARPQLGKWRLQNGIAIGTTLEDMESNSAEMRSANPWVRSIYVYF